MKNDLVFIVVIGICIILFFTSYSCSNNMEHFDATSDAAEAAVKKLYQADVGAIRTLADTATKLQAGSLTVPGVLSVIDNINVNNNTNEGGRIRIMNGLKTSAGQTKDWSIWNMTGQYLNKLSFWRYNGDGENAGPVLDLFDNGTVGVNGTLNVSGNTTTGGKFVEKGSELIPRGAIIMWTGSAAPGGWALCNGGNGTPDLRDRFIVGAGSGYGVGATGGTNEVVLSVAQIPSHTHTYSFLNEGYHRCDNDNEQRCSPDWTGGNTGATGGGAAHENRPPYYALAYIMKL